MSMPWITPEEIGVSDPMTSGFFLFPPSYARLLGKPVPENLAEVIAAREKEVLKLEQVCAGHARGYIGL